ncbi:MAG: response regulator transcription factor [Nitrospinae bacterium]|nr:response regulator transcription factor [Nitrospinota bacterium]MBL7020471.1 response regulator transcription factor [Nitrospinaceae bacterium]
MIPANNKIRVFIADDHFVVRQGLKHILSQNPDMEVIGEAEDGNQVLQRIKDLVVDVVLLDIEMPKKNGWEVMVQLKSLYPKLNVLMLSIFPEEHYGIRLIKAGASGYLTKSSAPDQLCQAIRAVASGGKFISPSLTEKVIAELNRDVEKLQHEHLSTREFQVFSMIVSGKKTKDIADELSLSITTISTHRSNILEKMGLKNSSELLQYALKNGFIRQDPISDIEP